MLTVHSGGAHPLFIIVFARDIILLGILLFLDLIFSSPIILFCPIAYGWCTLRFDYGLPRTLKTYLLEIKADLAGPR